MRNFLIAFFLINALCLTAVSGQTYKKYMRKADRLYRSGEYDQSVDFYKRALKLKKGNTKTTYQLGLAYLHSYDKLPALDYIRNVYSLSPNFEKDIEYQLGLAYYYNENFSDARKFFESFEKSNAAKKTDVADRIRQCILADSLTKNPIAVEILPVDQLNTKFHDYTPIVFNNGTEIIFTSNRPGSGGPRGRDGSYYEDIYLATFESNEWGNIRRAGPAVNVKYHDAAGSIAPDNKNLFLYYEYGGGDVYKSTFNENKWGEPVPLDENINSLYWETTATITEDGETMYFASDRPGGFGGLDLYKTSMDEKGNWSAPVNLGEEINTIYNEDAPYITPDGSRLYFGSAGHIGLGAEDIYYSEITKGKAGKPVNLGYPINSIYMDNYFVPSADLSEGYFSSMRPGGSGMADIYLVKIKGNSFTPVKPKSTPPVQPQIVKTETVPEIKKPEKKEIYYDEELLKNKETKNVVTLLKGKVIDSGSGEPLLAEILLVDNNSNKVLARVSSDEATGDFELVIPHGGNYGVSTKRVGYLFNSLNFDLPEFQEYQEVDTHILMKKAEAGTKVVLKNVFFDIGKSDLRIESLSELERILELLTDNPALAVQINGHTDNVGNSITNKVLSKKRAETVVKYLISNGISETRLSSKGYGEERPLVSNDDEIDGREINRRTEIEIVRNSEEVSP